MSQFFIIANCQKEVNNKSGKLYQVVCQLQDHHPRARCDEGLTFLKGTQQEVHEVLWGILLEEALC